MPAEAAAAWVRWRRWGWRAMAGLVALAILGGLMRDSLGAIAAGTPVSRSSTAASSLSWSHTVGNNSNRVLVVRVANLNSNVSVSSVTFGGAALTQLGTVVSHSSITATRASIWNLLAPAVGTATVQVTLSASTRVVASSQDFSGVSQTVPYGTVATSNGESTTAPTLNVSAGTGDTVIDLLAMQGVSSATLAAGSGQAAYSSATGSTASDVVGAASSESGLAGSVPMSWSTSNASPWAQIGVALRQAVSYTISGTVYEDVNYGGGAGRPMSTSSGVGRPGVTVELYDTNSNYVTNTTTGAGGGYSFTVQSADTYFVRVVNSTVTSSRTGAVGTLLPVQTFRNATGTGGPPGWVGDEVGGTNPAAPDSGPGSSGTALWTYCAAEYGTCSFSGTRIVRFGMNTPTASAWTAQILTGGTPCSTAVFGDPLFGVTKACYLLNAEYKSVSTVNASNGSVAGIDFGFNFDTVVNTNATGQGSLHQAITNANTLGGDAALAQSGRPVGIENVIFMLSNGTTGSGGSLNLSGGLRASNNYFTTAAGSAMVATIAQTTGLPTVSSPLILDAQTQPGWTGVPLIELNGSGSGSGSNGLYLNASSCVVRGFIINRFPGEGIFSGAGAGLVIQGNYIGLNAAGTAASGNNLSGIWIYSNAGGHVIGGTASTQRNVIGGQTNWHGIAINGGSGTVIRNNYIGSDVTGTVAIGNASDGIKLYGGVSNTTIGGVNAGEGNLIRANGARGVTIECCSTGNVIRGNSIFGNGNGNASYIGIDLDANGPNANNGTKGSGANSGMDYPVFTTASMLGTTLAVSGYVGSAASQSIFGGALVDIYISDQANPAGQGRTYLGTFTADASGNFSGNFSNIGGVTVGSTRLTATATDGSGNTSEFGTNFTVNQLIAGTVFEDVNYGGGAGRNRATALTNGGAVRPGAQVELYTVSGTTATMVTAATTDSQGRYVFNGLASGDYAVRVVSSTVTSSRSGAVAALIPVTTYRASGSSGSAADVTNEVGGSAPAVTNSYNQSLSPGNTRNTLVGYAEAFSLVSLSGAGISGIDFGYNFDSVTNLNDSGQGSLRQALINANTLTGDSSLDVQYRTPGIEHIVFMISNGTTGGGGILGLNGGLRSSLNYFSGGVATVTPVTALPALSTSMVLDGQTQPGWTANPIIELNGSATAAGTDGLTLSGAPVRLRGLVINRFKRHGLYITGAGATVQGCWIGLNNAGTAAAANSGSGIYTAGSGHTLGGTRSTDRNIVSGNTQHGVVLSADSGSAGNSALYNNRIGTNLAGTAAVANGLNGVYVLTTGNTLGSSVAGQGNVISGNGANGVQLDAGPNTVQGNYIGTSAAGSAAIGNVAYGIYVGGGSGHAIGGAASNQGNVISGNAGGIFVNAGGSNTIQGNFIGISVSGLNALGNTGYFGLELYGSGSNTVGGTAAGAGNVISGQSGAGKGGIYLASNNNTVQGNFIGTDSVSSAALPNAGPGIAIAVGNVTGNTIGGAAAGAANLIAFNGQQGVVVSGASSTGNRISRNAITGNTGIGIDIAGTGRTANNGTKTATLGNQDMDTPVFTAAILSGTTLAVSGYVGSAAGQGSFAGATVEIFKASDDGSGYGQGRTYLGTVTADASGNFNAQSLTVSGLAVGEAITATATDASGNTSEFAANVTVAAPAISGTVFEDLNYGGGAGRNRAAASGGSVRQGVRVELFTVSGSTATYSTATTTDSLGAYTFTGMTPGNYAVRVVTSTVSSSRAGYTAALRPVLTFRTDASSGTAVDVTDNVGGYVPAATDAGSAGAASVFSTSTGVFSAGPSGSATAFTLVSVSGVTTGADFGFNFNTVVNTSDSGAGSLRQAITNVNTLGGDTSLAQAGRTAGIENIIFMIGNGTAASGLRSAVNFFSAGVATIAPASQLPAMVTPLVLDAQTQPGWSAAPIVEINGAGAGAGASGLSAYGGVTIRGFVVNRFTLNGINLLDAAGNVVQGCYVGTNAAGTAASANNGAGVNVFNAPGATVGGTGTSQGNVISGNGFNGITLTGTAAGALVQGNLIGLNAAGTARVANGQVGIRADGGSAIIGGTSSAARNVISGSLYQNVLVTSAGVTVQGNYIGTNASGDTGIVNGSSGIDVNGASDVTGVTLGGSAAGAGNLIAGHPWQGVDINGAVTGVTVQRNRIFGNGSIGIDLADNGVTTNDGAKSSGQPNLLMDSPVFTSARATGASLTVAGYVGSAAGQSTFAGATVDIYLSDDNASGYGSGKTWLGVVAADASGNFSATLTLPPSGLPSGSLPLGSKLTATATDAAGNTSEFGVNFAGLIVDLVVNSNLDEADSSAGDGSCLTASGVCTLRAAISELNAWTGLAGPPSITFAIPGCASVGSAGCRITPATALPSVLRPVLIDGSTQPGFSTGNYMPLVELRGTATASGTTGLVIAGNGSTVRGLTINGFPSHGLTLSGSGGTLVGLRVGLNGASATALANGGAGLNITGSGASVGSSVNGIAAADSNTLAGNTSHGILISANGASVTNTFIGTDANATAGIGNGGSGVFTSASSLSGISISGTTIAGNNGNGVTVAGGAAQVQVGANSIAGNGALGIDLGNDGVTFNTGTTSSTRPNNGINQPVIIGAGVGGNAMTVYGYVGTGSGQAAFANARVEFFKAAVDPTGYGEGQTYLGSLTTDANGRFSGSVVFTAGALNVGDVVTATATDSAGNTSEFGPNWTTTTVAALKPGSFNAFDTDAAATALSGVIRSRVAGAATNLAVIALDTAGAALHPGFTGTVALSWVDARDDSGTISGSCRSSWVNVGAAGAAGSAVFNSANRVTVSVTPPAAATRVMRLKLSYTSGTGTVTACSNDAFAALPASLGWLGASDADSATAGTTRTLANTSASGGNVHRAGRPFTVRAQALDATGALMTGYDGTPVLATAGCLLPSGCSAATLTAANTAAVAGAYTHSNVSYAEVGVIQLQLTDSSYANVDSADTAANARTLASSLLAVGRFVPDSLTVSVSTPGQFATANGACLASGSGATFIGQGFTWAMAPQLDITAKNAAGATTTFWTGSLMKLTAAMMTETLAASGTGSATAGSSFGAVSVSDLGSGQVRVTASATDRFLLDSASAQDSVTPVWTFSATVNDNSEAAVSGNPSLSAGASQGSVTFNSGAVFHSGRLTLSPGYGDTRAGVKLLAQLQRYTAAGWVTMTEDQGCVTVNPNNVGVEAPVGVFTTAGACAAPMPAAVTTRGGRAWISLPATPGGAPGRLTLRLAGGGATGNSCTPAGAGAALVGLGLPWLLGGSSAAGPQAFATWGLTQRDAVLRREVW